MFFLFPLSTFYIFINFLNIFFILDINNKDIRDANNAHTDSDDEGESMDWYKAETDQEDK